MLRIGITGQNGFIGKHLFNTLKLFPQKYQLVNFETSFFSTPHLLENFVSTCDVIVHLAALNRHTDVQMIYETNILLVDKLVEALTSTNSKAQVIISSSTQEHQSNLYGNSKKIGRHKLINWSNQSGGKVVGMLIPNVFGPFGLPNYNSFVSTFCYKLAHGEQPQINIDAVVQLIYIGDLVQIIIDQIDNNCNIEKLVVDARVQMKVSTVLKKLIEYKSCYFERGEIPSLNNLFEVQLFNTFRSYINLKKFFPKKYVENTDNRGSFVEVVKLGIGGQVSFSTTKPGIVRGNHFHTRKIERFSVIRGKALIQLRKIGSEEIIEFFLDGDEPAYVDMPIWYTHNIINIGDDILYTIFWINECFDLNDTDTFMELV